MRARKAQWQAYINGKSLHKTNFFELFLRIFYTTLGSPALHWTRCIAGFLFAAFFKHFLLVKMCFGLHIYSLLTTRSVFFRFYSTLCSSSLNTAKINEQFIHFNFLDGFSWLFSYRYICWARIAEALSADYNLWELSFVSYDRQF